MYEVLEIINNEIYIGIAQWLMALLMGVTGGGGEIVGAVLQHKRATELMKQGEHYRKIGMQGMESLLSQRKMAYDNMWKMIYGGVRGTDFNQMFTDQQGVGFYRGKKSYEGGSDPTEEEFGKSTENQESTEKDLATSEKDYEESTMDRIDPTQTHGPNPKEGANLPQSETLHSVFKNTTGMRFSKRKRDNLQFKR